jgi:hypothetical protein
MEKQSSERNREKAKEAAPVSSPAIINHPKTEMPPSADANEPVEGEGSYQGTKDYDRHARDFVRSGQVEESAREAKQAVDENPDGMKQAEREAKKGPKH